MLLTDSGGEGTAHAEAGMNKLHREVSGNTRAAHKLTVSRPFNETGAAQRQWRLAFVF